MVTITGENFSNNAIDNAVMIGDALCLVQSSQPQEIICEIEPREITEDFVTEIGTVSVFLKLGETAACQPSSACEFTFNEPSATVTGFTTVYDQSLSMEHVVIVEGSGFGNTASPYDRMTVDGVEMTLLSLTDTEA